MKNLKRSIKIVINIFLVLFISFLFSCGGGYSSDSSNSSEFKNPIFGGDTLQ